MHFFSKLPSASRVMPNGGFFAPELADGALAFRVFGVELGAFQGHPIAATPVLAGSGRAPTLTEGPWPREVSA